jgi:dienelactone hydrolase
MPVADLSAPSPLLVVLRLRAWIIAVLLPCAASLHAEEAPSLLELTAGVVKFSAIGPLPKSPAPTVLIFAMDRQTSLQTRSFNRSGVILRDMHGFFCVSIDVPAHGEDARPGEKTGLPGWRARLERNENFVSKFVERATSVLSHLIAQGYTDRNRVAIVGTSRGGFLALHFAAANAEVDAIVALAPPVDLSRVREFAELKDHPLTRSLALLTLAQKPGLQKPIWITIGNNDDRVDTDECIRFARAVAEAAPAGTAMRPIELHVVPGDGHRQPPGTHENAAAWIARTFGF